jgi:hypothetical protein
MEVSKGSHDVAKIVVKDYSYFKSKSSQEKLKPPKFNEAH